MSSASTHWSIKNIIVRTILILIFLNSLCFYSLHRVFLTTNCPAMKDIVRVLKVYLFSEVLVIQDLTKGPRFHDDAMCM